MNRLYMISFLLVLATAAFGQGSAGERGATGVSVPDLNPNAEATIKKDRKRLRDIADHTVCTYRYTEPALKILKLRSRVDDILKSLQSIHPYMSYRINQRMAGVNWCLTEHLHRVSTDDVDSVTLSYLPQSQIAAIDLDAKIIQVYIDKKSIKEYPVDDQAMTIIHEVLHTFLDRRLKRRNEKIRGITKAIYTNYIDSKKTNYNRTYATQSLNATIDGSESVSVFESAEFGQAFYRFLRFSKEFDARQMVQRATNLNVAFEIMVNELQHAELFAALIFAREFFWNPPTYGTPNGNYSYLQERYKLLKLPIQWLFATATEFDQEPYEVIYKEYGYHSFPLGICTYSIEATNYDPQHIKTPYLVQRIYGGEYVPERSLQMQGNASIVFTPDVKISRAPSFSFGYPHFQAEQGEGINTYYRFVGEYQNRVIELISKIKKGYCSNPRAINLKYFY